MFVKFIKPGLLAIIAWAIVPNVGYSQGQHPQDTLKHYVAELQADPDDAALREKIIELVAEMIPAPTIPEEAEREFVKGITFLEKGKNATALALSISSFKQALLIAPWWPEAYYNLGIVLENAKRFDESIQNIKYYLYTKPPESEAKKAQRKIFEIEAEKDLAQAEEIARMKRAEEELRAKEPDFKGSWENTADSSVVLIISQTISGEYAASAAGCTTRDVRISGRRIRIIFVFPNGGARDYDLVLSGDGQELRGHFTEMYVSGEKPVFQTSYRRR
jgi:hypothetical protein